MPIFPHHYPEVTTMKNVSKSIVLFLLLALGLGACASEQAGDNKPVADLQSAANSNVRSRSFDHILEPGLLIKTTYSTTYGVETWHVTDSKTLEIKAEVGDGATKEVMIENMHADVSLQSDHAGVDGLPQDTMDDHLHAGDQPGFAFSTAHPYYESFSIEGYSETLISGWGFVVGSYGASEITEKRLTENNLLSQGVYAEKFTMVFDVLVRDNANEPWHKYVMTDEFQVKVYRT